MVVVTDRDSRVVARRKVTGKAPQLGEVLDWAAAEAAAGGSDEAPQLERPDVYFNRGPFGKSHLRFGK